MAEREFLQEKLGGLIDDIVAFAHENKIDPDAFAQKVAVMFKVMVDISTFKEYSPKGREE